VNKNWRNSDSLQIKIHRFKFVFSESFIFRHTTNRWYLYRSNACL